MRVRALLLAAAASFLGCAPTSEGRLVVLVVFDALHAGHVHHLGYDRETTPHLDALAAEGVSFRNAHAPAPYTVASTASIMTGLLPQRHGLLRPFGQHARPAGVTLAEHLRGAGWQTFGASANANASTATRTDLGFDTWVDLFEGPGPEGVQRVQRGDGSFIHLVGADEWPGQLEAFLDGWDGQRDAFVYLHALQPHSPYAPPAEHRERFVDPDYRSSWSDEEFPGGYAEGQDRPLARANRGEIPMEAADRQHTLDLYDASLHWMDAALGSMVDGLRERGAWDRTWLVGTSDHGEAFWQHGRFGHNDHLYEEMLRVPLVVRAPGGALPSGVVSDALVSPMDLFPSLLEWLRGETYQNWFYLAMFLVHLVLGLLLVLPVIFFGLFHMKNARNRPNRRAVYVGFALFGQRQGGMAPDARRSIDRALLPLLPVVPGVVEVVPTVGHVGMARQVPV